MLADAGKDIEDLAAERSGVSHAVGREEREPKVLREINQAAIEAFFSPNEMPLQLDIHSIASKRVEEKLRAVGQTPGSALPARLCAGVPASLFT